MESCAAHLCQGNWNLQRPVVAGKRYATKVLPWNDGSSPLIQLSHWQLWVPFHVLNVRGTWLSLWRVLWRRFETFNQEVLHNKAQNCRMFIMFYKFYPFLQTLTLFPQPLGSVVSTPVHGRFPGLAVDSPRGLSPTRRLDQSPRWRIRPLRSRRYARASARSATTFDMHGTREHSNPPPLSDLEHMHVPKLQLNLGWCWELPHCQVMFLPVSVTIWSSLTLSSSLFLRLPFGGLVTWALLWGWKTSNLRIGTGRTGRRWWKAVLSDGKTRRSFSPWFRSHGPVGVADAEHTKW